MEKKTVTRLVLSKRLHKQLSGGIAQKKLQHCISVIIEQVAKDLVQNQVVTIRHFGTLSPHIRSKHLAIDISSGKMRTLPATKSVKFHTHCSFLSLISDRKDKFRNKKKPLD